MASYMLIESRDPFESADAHHVLQLAAQLLKEKHDVTLMLVQNAAAVARPNDRSKAYSEIARAGAKILVDDLALAERGIHQSKLAPGMSGSSIEAVIDAMEAGTKVIWH